MSKPTGTVLVTGGTVGLGYQAALQIAQKHPELQVVVASRSDKESSAESINKSTGRKNVMYLPLDLGNLKAVRSFASEYKKKNLPPIQALILNAGLQFPDGVVYSDDGMEKTFAINHVGHALLFYLLKDRLSPDARIVLTASGVHDPNQPHPGIPDAIYRNAEELAHPTPETAKYDGRQRYATSKLANVMWTYALDRHIKQAGKQWTVTAMDPGLLPGTGLAREAGSFAQWIWKSILPHIIPLLRLLYDRNIHTTAESGFALARLGVGEDVQGKSALYFEGLKEIKSSKDSYREPEQEELWDWTIKAIAQDKGEAQEFQHI